MSSFSRAVWWQSPFVREGECFSSLSIAVKTNSSLDDSVLDCEELTGRTWNTVRESVGDEVPSSCLMVHEPVLRCLRYSRTAVKIITTAKERGRENEIEFELIRKRTCILIEHSQTY